MTYELELLEYLVTKLLEGGPVWIPDVNDSMPDWQTILNDEKVRIKKRMKATVADPGIERDKERYVQRSQQDIVNLIGRVTEKLSPKSLADFQLKNDDAAIVFMYKFLLNELTDLFEFIQTYFPSYFDQDQNAPFNYVMQFQFLLREKFRKIKKAINSVEQYRPLATIVFLTIEKTILNAKQPVPYRKLSYLQKLISELEQLQEFPTGEQHFLTPLSKLLVYVNFNCSKTVHYLIESIIQEIEWLYKTLKEMNQLPVKPSMKLILSAISLREQLVGWIEEEIGFLEKKRTLFPLVPPQPGALRADEKVAFNSPQPVLSLLVRSAIDSKLINNTVKKEVFEKISNMVSTPGAKNLQVNSLVKKSYDPERTYRDQAIGILHEMIRCIMKY